MTKKHNGAYRKKVREWTRKTAKPREEKPFDPGTADCERMPLGCWIWLAVMVLVLGAAAGFWKPAW